MNDDRDFEELAPGAEVQKDDAGRITKARLSSERARELNAAGREKKAALLEAHRGDLADALIDLLVDSQDTKAESLELLVRELAATASAGSASQRVRSLEILLSLIGVSHKQDAMRAPRPEENCPLCSRGPMPQARMHPETAVGLEAQLAAWAMVEAGILSRDNLRKAVNLIEARCELETAK